MMNSIAFMGGGNMARAILGGLLRQGQSPSSIWVVEPHGATAAALVNDFGVRVFESPASWPDEPEVLLWAVKPQVFGEAAKGLHGRASAALHVSVMAGIRSHDLARAVGTERVVRVMPNTPALIGQGMSGLCARAVVSEADRAVATRLLQATGEVVWLEDEHQLDAVTAISGSGPAYVFYMIEALQSAAEQLGLPATVARQLVLGTFSGATALARASHEPVGVLRERVTSKGGTTAAALQVLSQQEVGQALVAAAEAAQRRAVELGDELAGRPSA